MPRRLFKHLAQLRLALAIKLAHDLRPVEVNEMHAAFGGNSARQQRLSRTRRPIQQHTFRRENPQPFKDVRIL